MPHDRKGELLKVGDEVVLKGKITQIFESEACNLVVQFPDAPEGISDTLTVTAAFAEKA